MLGIVFGLIIMAFSYKRIYTFPRCGLASVLDNFRYHKGWADVEYIRVTKLFDDSQIELFKPDLILVRDCLDIFCSLWSAGPKNSPRTNLSDYLIEKVGAATVPYFGDIPVVSPYEIAGEVKIGTSNSFNFDRLYNYGLINDVAYNTCCGFREQFNRSVFR